VDIRLCLALNNLGALKLRVASAGGVSPKGPGRIRPQIPTRLLQFHTELLPCVEPIAAALVAIGADQPFDIGFHRDLPHGLHDSSQEILSPLYCSSSTSAIHSVFAHRPLVTMPFTRAGLHVIEHSARRVLAVESSPRSSALTTSVNSNSERQAESD
jgi:hypothetical protein